MSLMPVKTAISDIYPNPDNDTARAGFGALWDAMSEATEATELDLASAATVNIGGQLSTKLRITGTTGPITSLGTTYRGPILLRFAGAVPITHNATTLILPGGANLTTSAGGTMIAYPKATAGVADGWVVAFSSDYIAAQLALKAAKGANSDITSLTALASMSAFYASGGTTASSALAAVVGMSEVFDRNGDFNPTTGRFTAPVAGVYDFAAGAQCGSTQGFGIACFFRVNGVATNYGTGRAATPLTVDLKGVINANASAVLNLAAGDYVEFWMQLTGTGFVNGAGEYFCGKRIL